MRSTSGPLSFAARGFPRSPSSAPPPPARHATSPNCSGGESGPTASASTRYSRHQPALPERTTTQCAGGKGKGKGRAQPFARGAGQGYKHTRGQVGSSSAGPLLFTLPPRVPGELVQTAPPSAVLWYSPLPHSTSVGWGGGGASWDGPAPSQAPDRSGRETQDWPLRRSILINNAYIYRGGESFACGSFKCRFYKPLSRMVVRGGLRVIGGLWLRGPPPMCCPTTTDLIPGPRSRSRT